MKQSCEESTLVLAGIAEVLSDSPACLRLPLEVGTDHRLVLATDRCRRCRSVRDMEKGERKDGRVRGNFCLRQKVILARLTCFDLNGICY
jgi:hypothetical protein